MGALEQGVGLMITGMAAVFVFLAILVSLMQTTAWFFKKYAHLFPEPQAEEPKARPAAGGDEMQAVALAIAAANHGV